MLYIICQLCTISFLLYGWKWVISVLYKRIQHTTQCTGQRTCWDSCPRYSILICSNGCLSAWLAAKLIWFDGCQSYSTMNPFLSLVHTCSHFYIQWNTLEATTIRSLVSLISLSTAGIIWLALGTASEPFSIKSFWISTRRRATGA